MIVADGQRKLISGIYIEYPKIDLFVGPHQHKSKKPNFSIPGDLGSIPGHVIPKTFKMVLDTSLLNTRQY